MDMMDSLLSTTMENVDLPAEYVDVPAGNYRFEVKKAEGKAGKDKDNNDSVKINVQLEIAEVVELANPDDTPPRVGDLVGQSFVVSHPTGLEFFKGFCAKLIPADVLNSASIGDILAVMPETQFTATAKTITRNNYTSTRLNNIEVK